MRNIPEAEFMEHGDKVRHELQRAIVRSGLSIAEIARGTRMTWNTVYNVSQGMGVRLDSACRIMYFLDKVREDRMGQEEDKAE